MRRNLRDRKKDRTRSLLAEAAFEIVRSQGPDKLTAEAVANLAGVSRRTFFNYFPSIDAACAHSAELLLAELTEALESRPADEDVWDTMTWLLSGEAGGPVIERLAILSATRETSPQARHLAHDHVDVFVAWLTDWLTSRLGPDTDRLYAATLAASVAATADTALRIWGEREGGATTPAALAAYRQLLLTALGMLRAGFDSPATR